MIHLTLAAKTIQEGMSEEDIFEAARGDWVIGARGRGQRFALFAHQGTVIQAVLISKLVRTVEIEDAPGEHRDHRYRIDGQILEPGHPAYDKYVGKPSPRPGARNPVSYLEDEMFSDGFCRCGCKRISRNAFLPGHDQKAIHARIAKIGSVSDFLDWFDETFDEAESATKS